MIFVLAILMLGFRILPRGLIGLGVDCLNFPNTSFTAIVSSRTGGVCNFGRSTRTLGRSYLGLLRCKNPQNGGGVKRYNIHEFSTSKQENEADTEGKNQVIINDSRYLVMGNVVHYCRGSSEDALCDVLDNAVRLSGGSIPPSSLLVLGSIWYASGEFSNPTNSKLNSALVKPVRLNPSSAPLQLNAGDYMRVHFNPRRFPIPPSSITVVRSDENLGYMVVDKPRGLPCHPTVDNAEENLVEMLGGGEEGR